MNYVSPALHLPTFGDRYTTTGGNYVRRAPSIGILTFPSVESIFFFSTMMMASSERLRVDGAHPICCCTFEAHTLGRFESSRPDFTILSLLMMVQLILLLTVVGSHGRDRSLTANLAESVLDFCGNILIKAQEEVSSRIPFTWSL